MDKFGRTQTSVCKEVSPIYSESTGVGQQPQVHVYRRKGFYFVYKEKREKIHWRVLCILCWPFGFVCVLKMPTFIFRTFPWFMFYTTVNEPLYLLLFVASDNSF
jgi:hypothetical protein